MHIAIYGKSFDENSTSYVQDLISSLVKNNVQLSCFENFEPYLSKRIMLPNDLPLFKDYSDLKSNKPDFLISLGGDGTMLRTVTLVRDLDIPIVGINTGRLGFLANVAKEHVEQAVEELIKGNFTIDSRTLIQLEGMDGFGELNFALNEFTIHKKDSSSMITIRTNVDGEYLNSYWADGLIIATPTGSTAYSLSCGGPIISPKSNCFVINPIAPHNLNMRPIVLSDDVVIDLVAEGRSNEFLVNLDSRSQTVQANTKITLKKCPFTIKKVRLPEHNFFNTIQQKLNWGIDKRN